MSLCRRGRGVHPPAPVILNPPQEDTNHDAEHKYLFSVTHYDVVTDENMVENGEWMAPPSARAAQDRQTFSF